MNGDGIPRQRRQRRGPPACDGVGSVADRGVGRSARGGESSLGGRTATRALIAVGTYAAQDLRDAEGLMRPMLRRGAIRLASSHREPVRRLGVAYLRLDPPAQDVISGRGDAIEVVGASSSLRTIAAAPGTIGAVADGEELAI